MFCDDCGGLLRRTAGAGGNVQTTCPRCKPDTPRARAPKRAAAPSQSSSQSSTPSTRSGKSRPRERGFGSGGQLQKPKPEQPRRAPKELPPPQKLTLPADRDLFPYDEVRDGQREFLADVAQAAEGGKHLVANAPTGLGKTVSSLAPLVAYAIRHNKRVFFLTSKQSQHKIAIDTLRRVREKAQVPFVVSDIIGKQDMCPRREARELFSKRFSEFCRRQQVNHECSYFENQNTKMLAVLKQKIHHVEETVLKCTDGQVCPHQAAMDLAVQAHVVVCDYNYFFSEMREGIQDRLKFDLSDVILVVDEAHNLPDRIRDHLSLELNEYMLEDVLDELKDLDAPRLGRLVEGIHEAILQIGRTEPAEEEASEPGGRTTLGAFGAHTAGRRPFDGAERLVTREEFIETVNARLAEGVATLTESDYATLLDELMEASDEYEKRFKEAPRAIGMLREFLTLWKIERRGLVRLFQREPTPTLAYKMLDAAVLSRGVFDAVHASVLMSGTLHPLEMCRDILGLAKDRAVLRYYPSPFPRENRDLMVDTAVTTAYQERGPEMFRRIAERLARFAEATPGNVAAFFPSYTILEEVRIHLPHYMERKELVVEERGETKGQKEGLVGQLRRGGDALLAGVQGGSLSEGYDYEDNLLKGVVIVGLPFGPPTLEVQALIDFYEKKFGKRNGRNYAYVHPTMNRVLQAAGRCIRTPDDKGVIVLMDKRFDWGSYRATLPRDFQPRVSDDPARDTRQFWIGR